MGMRETFQIIIDVATENSQKSLKGLRSEVSKTEGGFNKFKVGVSGGMDFVKDHAAAFALGAGTALVGFGIKAVAAFEDTAKAALDLSAATGLAVEDASRWIAVGDDFQISAETLTSSIGKIGKTLDADKWAKYGIATRDASGQARDANDILTESLGMLSGIENGTERARIGNELFGKGYAALSPMIGHTTDEYKKMLGTVEAGQVITQGEAEQAEQMRLAQDKLSDAIKEVELAAGKAATKLAPLLNFVAEVVSSTALWGDTGQAVDTYSAALDKNSKLVHTSGGLARAHVNAFGALRDELTKNISGFDAFGKIIEGFVPNFDDAGDQTRDAFKDLLDKQGPQKAQELLDSLKLLYSGGTQADKDYVTQLGINQSQLDKWQAKIDDAGGATKQNTDATKDSTTADKEAAAAIEEKRLAQEKATAAAQAAREEALRNIDADFNYRASIQDTKTELEKYTKTTQDHKLSKEEQQIATDEMVTKMAAEASAYAASKGLAEGSKGAIDAMIASLYIQAAAAAPGSALQTGLSEYILKLQAINAGLTPEALKLFNMQSFNGKAVNMNMPPAQPPAPKAHGATGGIVTRPTNALIGEAGPEMVIPLSSMPGASPLPSMSGSGSSINLTVNAGLGTDGAAVGQQIVNMLKQYQRTNGPFDFTSR